MKRILLATGCALAIHAFFLGTDPAWLTKRRIHKPETSVFNMTLDYRQPSRAKPEPKTKRPKSPARKLPSVSKKKKKQSVPKPEKTKKTDEHVIPEKEPPSTVKKMKEKPVPDPEKPKKVLTPVTPSESDQPPEKVSVLRQGPSDIPESEQAPPPKTELADINKDTPFGLGVFEDEVFEKEISESDEGLEPLPPPSVSSTVQEAEPLYRKNPRPEYPRLARRRGYEGTVVLEVLVDEDGTVKDLRLFSSSEHRVLDRAAVASVKKWLFKPGMRGDEPVEMWVRIPIRFRLK